MSDKYYRAKLKRIDNQVVETIIVVASGRQRCRSFLAERLFEIDLAKPADLIGCSKESVLYADEALADGDDQDGDA